MMMPKLRALRSSACENSREKHFVSVLIGLHELCKKDFIVLKAWYGSLNSVYFLILSAGVHSLNLKEYTD